MPDWVPASAPPDNRPGGAVRPRWHLHLDDPEPSTAVVVGTAGADVEDWLADVGATVVRPDGPAAGPVPADAVVVGPDVEVDDALLRWVATACGPDGGAWLPVPASRRLRGRLTAAGFAVQRPVGTPSGRRGTPPGTGVVVAREGPADRPPTWLARLGSTVGWDPAAGTWTLRTPSAYPSQKTVAVLHADAGPGTSAVVKVTQHPRFNARLDNEHLRLRELWLDGGPAAARAPMALASARVAGLAAVVEERVDARPFLEASTLAPGCPLADDAVAAITALGRSTVEPVAGATLAAPLDDLVRRFTARAAPTRDVAAFLHAQVEVLGAAREVPSVLFHGDLGTWNAVVTPTGVRILDWESAAPGGPPLWDLAYFTRSLVVRRGRRWGLRRDAAINRHLLRGTTTTDAVRAWFDRYRTALDLDPRLVGPLFHTCWVHRAVKEAARLPDGAPGVYGPLCSRLAAGRSSPGLRRLLDV